MTPAEHRATAEDMLATAETYPTNVLARADLISRATVHALLALEHPPRPEVIYVNLHDVSADQIADLVRAAGALTDAPPPKPTPRKRAAKKTTASKETSK